MSGGSFDYVSVKDILDGDGAWPSDEHERIIDALAKYPGTDAAVHDARAALMKWRDSMREVAGEWRRLSPLLKAVEWHHSGDWGEENVKAELEAYMAALGRKAVSR